MKLELTEKQVQDLTALIWNVCPENNTLIDLLDQLEPMLKVDEDVLAANSNRVVLAGGEKGILINK